MIIIPSIDIKNGACVRLIQGDFTQVSSYSSMPCDIAAKFCNWNVPALHVVDLDGAKSGNISQIECIQSIRSSFQRCIQVGGGIRHTEDIDILLKLGVDRIVIGSNAVLDQKTTKKWLEKYGPDVIVLALDFRIKEGQPYLAVQGWQQDTQKNVWSVLDSYPTISYVLCTDISKDGMQTGPNFEFYREIKQRYPALKIQASGGITSIQDISELKKLQLYGAVIGKALYENKLDLQEAILCSKSE